MVRRHLLTPSIQTILLVIQRVPFPCPNSSRFHRVAIRWLKNTFDGVERPDAHDPATLRRCSHPPYVVSIPRDNRTGFRRGHRDRRSGACFCAVVARVVSKPTRRAVPASAEKKIQMGDPAQDLPFCWFGIEPPVPVIIEIKVKIE